MAICKDLFSYHRSLPFDVTKIFSDDTGFNHLLSKAALQKSYTISLSLYGKYGTMCMHLM